MTALATARRAARAVGRRAGRIVRSGSRVARANWRQLVVTGLIALGVAASAILTGQATGEWQSMTRQETKRSAAAVEDITFVYGAEAPQAVRVAVAEARAGWLELDAGMRGDDGALERIEAASERQYVWQLRFAEKGKGTLLDGDAYRRADGSYDIQRRLAATRAANPELVRLDPDEALRTGDRKARWAALCATVAVPLLAYYYLMQLLPRRRSRNGENAEGDRREEHGDEGDGDGDGDGASGGGEEELDEIPPMPASRDAHRRLMWLTNIAWILFTVLVAPQLYFGNQEQRAQALAAREGTRVTAEIQASGALDAFQRESRRLVLTHDLKAATREYVNLDTQDAVLAAQQEALAHADRDSGAKLGQIVAAMSRAPGPEDGVDPVTRALIGASPAEWKAGLRRQGEQLAAADKASGRNNHMTVAILFAGLAFSISALAMLRARTAGPKAGLLAAGTAVLLAASVLTIVRAALP
ncbi:hypothetical protein ACGFNU_00265 [Spirillospora sp. NPDC048911]|uniref:hypothetical protein n=1 Tax=Spirillospora sp. NPDC048911 TaxID=3364527 RepID=UPI003711333F